MLCDHCMHCDGKYCCDGIIPDADVRINKIPKLIDDIEEQYGCVIDWNYDKCEYCQEDDEDGYNLDLNFDNWRECLND